MRPSQTTSWRDRGWALLKRSRQALPLLISAGLITWLVVTITPAQLFKALATSNWPWLIVATAIQVIGLFLWDTICVWWLFSQPDRRLPFGPVLRLRADTVIWSAINLEIGQAVFAWRLAKNMNVPVANTLSYCVLLSLVDLSALLGLALVGSFVYPSPLTGPWRWLCLGGLAVVGVLIGSVKILPESWRRWLASKPWAEWTTWINWRTGGRLVVLRLIMFLLVLIYAGAGLAICRVPVGPPTVVGIIPFVLLAESLPGTAGLGERETALVYLYPGGDEQRAVLLSFGLIWSTVVILGRILISLISWYLLPERRVAEELQAADSPR